MVYDQNFQLHDKQFKSYQESPWNEDLNIFVIKYYDDRSFKYICFHYITLSVTYYMLL